MEAHVVGADGAKLLDILSIFVRTTVMREILDIFFFLFFFSFGLNLQLKHPCMGLIAFAWSRPIVCLVYLMSTWNPRKLPIKLLTLFLYI